MNSNGHAKVPDGLILTMEAALRNNGIIHGAQIAARYLADNPECQLSEEQLKLTISEIAVANNWPVQIGE